MSRNLTARQVSIVIMSDMITSTSSRGRFSSGNGSPSGAVGKVICDILKGWIYEALGGLICSTISGAGDLPPIADRIASFRALNFIVMS